MFYENDSALCSYEWNDWIEEYEYFDVPAFNAAPDFYFIILHDMTIMIEKDYYMLLLSN